MIDPSKTSKCRGCGADIIWGKTSTGKPHPFNARGTIVLVAGQNGELQVHSGYSSHFGTCPKAAEFKRSADGKTS
jgi:hypothetical protein